jgi:hypothetical protein
MPHHQGIYASVQGLSAFIAQRIVYVKKVGHIAKC